MTHGTEGSRLEKHLKNLKDETTKLQRFANILIMCWFSANGFKCRKKFQCVNEQCGPWGSCSVVCLDVEKQKRFSACFSGDC